MRSFFLYCWLLKEIHAILLEAWREYAPAYATFSIWVAQFKLGIFPSVLRLVLDDTKRWPPQALLIKLTRELTLEDRRIRAKLIAEKLSISRERVGSFIHEDLYMRQLSAKWVSNRLIAEQKFQRCQSSEQILEYFRGELNDFLSRLVTINETWLYRNYQETMQQSVEWRHSGSPRPKNSEFKNPLENLSPRFFYIKAISSSLTIFQRATLSLLGVIYFCWCNWRIFWRECLDHPTYATDLSPSDCQLFQCLKIMNVLLFPSALRLLLAAEFWLNGQFSEVFGRLS